MVGWITDKKLKFAYGKNRINGPEVVIEYLRDYYKENNINISVQRARISKLLNGIYVGDNYYYVYAHTTARQWQPYFSTIEKLDKFRGEKGWNLLCAYSEGGNNNELYIITAHDLRKYIIEMNVENKFEIVIAGKNIIKKQMDRGYYELDYKAMKRVEDLRSLGE